MGIHRCHHHHQHPPPKQHHHHHHHHHQPAPHLHHIQIRPLRADLDVQRVGKAGEEKENHSEDTVLPFTDVFIIAPTLR